MSSQSSLYAEKIFSEHPLGFWSLDDNISYLSLLGTNSELSTWTITGAVRAVSSELSSPIRGSSVYKITGQEYTINSGVIKLSSPSLFKFNQLDSVLGNLTVSTYFYAQYPTINYISLSLEYSGQKQTKTFTSVASGQWGLLSETFTIPAGYQSNNVSISLEISYDEDTTPGTEYNFFVSAPTAGQYSEESNSIYLGASSETFDSSIAISETGGIKLNAYGIQDTPAYYVVKNKVTFARNTGMPLVFGASTSTTVYENETGPSIVFPGFGFLNKMGQYKDLTLEAWLRLDSNTSEPKRIIGPVASSDGLYVDGSFFVLKIGEYSQSYFISEWGKPMLIHIRIVNNFASLLINGEQVISFSLSTESLDLPEQLSPLGKEQDWVGVYSYSDIASMKISGVAIYPYQVSEIIAKRRFVYGQGVDFPDSARSSASGSIVFVDYPFAEYTNNYSYPDFGKWDQGAFDNVSILNNTLSTPTYDLPNFFIAQKQLQLSGLSATTSKITFTVSGQNSLEVGDTINISGLVVNNQNTSIYNLSGAKVTEVSGSTFAVVNAAGVVASYVSGGTVTGTVRQSYDQLMSDNLNLQDAGSPFWSLKPNTTWSNTNAYMLFESLDILNQTVKTFYGVFESDLSDTGRRVLFRIDNEYNTNYFEIVLNGSIVEYAVSYGNLGRSIVHSYTVSANEQFSVGINIPEFAKRFSSNLPSIFGDLGQIKLYIGGYKTLQSKFNGKIYRVGFMTSKNYEESATDLFDSNFVAYNADGLISHNSSYAMSPATYFDKFDLDISAYAIWEDYAPLRYFAKYIKDATNNSYYDLDFLQFNVSYPESVVDGSQYDTEGQIVKTYISFQPNTGSSNTRSIAKTFADYSSIVPASSEGTVNAGDEWVNSVYEVVDGMIIYPPSSISVNDISIVTHIVMNNPSTRNKKVNIRLLSYASESFDDLSPNMIGTRFGASMYPYTRLGVYLDYKRKNPFTIYRGSTPYLFLTKNSGIRLRGKYGQPASRGIATSINKSKSSDYLLNAIQLSVRYDQPLFPQNALELFEIQGVDSQIRIYVESDNASRTRGRIFAVDTVAGKIDNAVVFYINGVATNRPVISLSDWNMLGIQFTGKLDMSNYSGEFRITGPAIVNNISYYQYDQSRQAQTITFREWINVLFSDEGTLDWDYWDSPTLKWRDVLYILSSKTYDTDLSQVYKRYVGTNKVIFDSGHGLVVNKYRYPFYRGISWKTSTISPV